MIFSWELVPGELCTVLCSAEEVGKTLMVALHV